jgi:hypothetical protein
VADDEIVGCASLKSQAREEAQSFVTLFLDVFVEEAEVSTSSGEINPAISRAPVERLSLRKALR